MSVREGYSECVRERQTVRVCVKEGEIESECERGRDSVCVSACVRGCRKVNKENQVSFPFIFFLHFATFSRQGFFFLFEILKIENEHSILHLL